MIRSYCQSNKENFLGQLHPERLLIFLRSISKSWLIKQSIASFTIVVAIFLKQSGISEIYFNAAGCMLLGVSLAIIIKPEWNKQFGFWGNSISISSGIWITLWFFGQNILADIFACGTYLFVNTIGKIIRKQETTPISYRVLPISYLISGIISNISTFVFLLVLSQIHTA